MADKSFHLNVTKKLRQDVCVRWNSTYLMLESSLYYKDVLDYWGQRDKDYQIFALSNEEWRNVAILCKFLKVFYNMTCVFSGSNYPMANLYFRGVWKVHKVLLDTVKDPRYKLNYVQYCFITIYGIHASDFVETILSNLRLLFDDTRSEKSQLDIYLEEPELELNSQIDVLDYWSKSSVRYNELSLLAYDLLAIPISTVASESAFSMGKKVITLLRSSLKPKTVQAVVCLDDWMRAKGFSTEIGCKNDKDNEDDEDDEDDVSSIAF
ncbi:hypothetical protein PVK06_031790 [Gossypium arboreum]|uniref:HAT C-terminal dimerisation domain-containing protein n=1 Tax=Gossypium arboreum TaxID=29729 RepID=A0ABR0NUL8_GOSAR|nr:hypothetical protein PVK06_031790 [Gossypium arboreum]